MDRPAHSPCRCTPDARHHHPRRSGGWVPPLAGAGKVTLDGSLNTSDATALFAYSPALLPKPLDWPQHYHVVGQLEHRQRGASFGMQTSGRGGVCSPNALPGPLQEYLDRCRQNNHHVVYVGFGSLSFFDPGRVTEILDTVAEAIEQVAAVLPVRAVIQTTLSSTPGKTATMSRAMTDVERPFFAFSETVDHRQLFPQASLIVCHGGIGTVQAALAAGKPVLSMCCLPTADQSFWADLVHRRRLGPRWFGSASCPQRPWRRGSRTGWKIWSCTRAMPRRWPKQWLWRMVWARRWLCWRKRRWQQGRWWFERPTMLLLLMFLSDMIVIYIHIEIQSLHMYSPYKVSNWGSIRESTKWWQGSTKSK
jgi:hypothetical protein